MIRPAIASAILLVCSAVFSPTKAQEILPDGTEAARNAISGFRYPSGMKMELFAVEPQLSGPVAICLDEKGRVFVAEEYRFNRGTEENHTRPFFLEDDLQIESLDDRLAMYRKFEKEFEGGMEWFTKVSDQVRLLEDTNGDGRAEVSKIFAGKFNGVLDGLAAGVIARDGDIYLTCIPHLWLLRDNDGDGVAELNRSKLEYYYSWRYCEKQKKDQTPLCPGEEAATDAVLRLQFRAGTVDLPLHPTTTQTGSFLWLTALVSLS